MGNCRLLRVFQCRRKLTSTFAGEESKVRGRSSETYKHESKGRAKRDIKDGIAKGGGTVERCRVTEKKKKRDKRRIHYFPAWSVGRLIREINTRRDAHQNHAPVVCVGLLAGM